jgi:hypothetical protein
MTKTGRKAEGPAVRATADETPKAISKSKSKVHKANSNTHPAGWGAKASKGLKAFHKDPEKQKHAEEWNKLHPEQKIKAAAYRARKREEAIAAAATPAKKKTGPKV